MTEYRHEYKYMIDAGQKAVLKLRAQGVLERDAHAGADGAYLIRSLYFDSPDDACFMKMRTGTIRGKSTASAFTTVMHPESVWNVRRSGGV